MSMLRPPLRLQCGSNPLNLNPKLNLHIKSKYFLIPYQIYGGWLQICNHILLTKRHKTVFNGSLINVDNS